MDYVAKVDGMSCDGCANAVKSAFSDLDGVTNVTVNLSKKEVFIQSDSEVTKEQLDETLEGTSYTVQSLLV